MNYGENPGGSHEALSNNIKRELKSYKILGNHVKRYKFANRFVKNKRVLEVGCAYGFGKLILRNYLQYVGIDIDQKAISWARNNIDSGSFLITDDFVTKFSEQSFDIVLAFEVIEHVEDPKIFLNFLKKYCKPGGKIIISTPNGYYSKHAKEKFRNKFHIDEYSLPELKSFISDLGFSATYYKEHRVDHLDSIWLKQMENNSLEVTKSIKRRIFEFGLKYLNRSIFWHICKVETETEGYSTIIAILEKP